MFWRPTAVEIIPALAHDASRPGSAASYKATFIPAAASAKAINAPIRPLPATTHHKFSWPQPNPTMSRGCVTSKPAKSSIGRSHADARGVHGPQVEIEISGRFRRVPTVCTARRCGINIIQRRKTVCALGHPIKRPWKQGIQLFPGGPKNPVPPGLRSHLYPAHTRKSAPSSFTSIGTAPARLARIKHKHRSLRVTGRSHARRI
jgi:hypothetical protein